MDDKYVPLADVFLNLHEGVVVGELEHFRLSQRYVQVLADRLGQFRVGVAGKYLQLVQDLFH